MSALQQPVLLKENDAVGKKKARKALSKFTLLRCLEEYFSNDHDHALLLTNFVWERKDHL